MTIEQTNNATAGQAELAAANAASIVATAEHTAVAEAGLQLAAVLRTYRLDADAALDHVPRRHGRLRRCTRRAERLACPARRSDDRPEPGVDVERLAALEDRIGTITDGIKGLTRIIPTAAPSSAPATPGR